MQVIELDPSPSFTLPPASSSKSKSSQSTSRPRKPERACDFCRRRKTKCDGPWSKDHVCSNCRSSKLQCTYIESSKPRGPPKAYITALQDRVEQTEQLLKRLRPDLDLVAELGPPIERDSWKSDFKSSTNVSLRASPHSCSSGSPEINVPIRPGLPNTARTRNSQSPPHQGVTDDEVDACGDSDSDSKGSGESPPRPRWEDTQQSSTHRYMGKSSSNDLIKATLAVKKEYDRAYEPHLPHEHHLQLPEYEYLNWHEIKPIQPYNFPPPDLCDHLLEQYFLHVNSHFPLLHQPTFEAHYRSSLHTHDRAFAALFLSVLAVASRWSNDPRVLDHPSASKLSSGWSFLRESFKYRPTALAPACLFDIQRFAMASTFLRWTRHAPTSWTMVGLGLRLAQDVGAHRKKRYHSRPTVEDELWKRAFWLLVVYDRLGSASLGRPCCSREEDFDIDLPLEVDDEYWINDDPNVAFKQPPGKPSKVACITSFIKLTQMMAFTLRTIYCIDKTKVLLGLVGPTWREQVIAQLNDAMDEWTESLPDFLKWGPQLDPLFENQSATLYTTYYLLLLLVYRPFIPPPSAPRLNGKPEITEEYPFPALAICVSAARAGVRILETQMAKGMSNTPNMIAVAHLCGALLLLNVWEVKKQDEEADVRPFLADIHTCLQVLEYCKDKWEAAAHLLLGLKAGLPDELEGGAESPKVPREASAKIHGPPAKPPMPPGGTDYPHERAMQPPSLTDGWHWFSQRGLGPAYAVQRQFDLGSGNPSVHTTISDTRSQLPTRVQVSGSQPPPPVTLPTQPYSRAQVEPLAQLAYTATHIPNMSSGSSAVPWWMEPAIIGRAAYGQPYSPIPLSTKSPEIEAHAGGTIQQWQSLAQARPPVSAAKLQTTSSIAGYAGTIEDQYRSHKPAGISIFGSDALRQQYVPPISSYINSRHSSNP